MGFNLSLTRSLNTPCLETSIDWTPSKITTSFSSWTLHAVNLLLWKKMLSLYFQNHCNRQTKLTPQRFVIEKSGFLTKGGTGRGLPPHAQNFEPPPFVWCYPPPRNWIIPLSFMSHLVPALIVVHMLYLWYLLGKFY